MGKKITIQKASELLGVTVKTLKIWDNDNILKATYRTPGGHRRYDLDDILSYIGSKPTVEINNSINNKVFVYARVSTKKQKDSGNLDRQVARLIDYVEKNHYELIKIYKEVASGLNENRKQLMSMLNNLDNIDKIIVEYPDRLARFGLNYILLHCKKSNVEVVYVEDKESKSLNEELVQDLISIVTCFSARLYGARGGKKIKNEIKKTLNIIE